MIEKGFTVLVGDAIETDYSGCLPRRFATSTRLSAHCDPAVALDCDGRSKGIKVSSSPGYSFDSGTHIRAKSQVEAK